MKHIRPFFTRRYLKLAFWCLMFDFFAIFVIAQIQVYWEHEAWDALGWFCGFLLLFALMALAMWRIDRTVYLFNGLRQYVNAMQAAGIYIIRCEKSGAEYLGSTRKNFHARWGQHIGSLNQRKHENARLQADWLKYGPDAFQFYIVEIMGITDRITARETELLKMRAQQLPPILNYNVAHSRVYPVPAAPEQV